MTPRVRKRVFDGVRIALCAAALWFVVRGVTLDDYVTLGDGVTQLSGTIHATGLEVRVEQKDGETRVLAMTEIAVDESGSPRIEYGLRTAWRNSKISLLALAALIFFPVVFLQAERLRWLLAAQAISVRFWECVKLSLAGNFLNFAAPLGSTAGDVFKAYFVSLHTHQKTEAMTTVVLDRVIGLATLIAVVAAITTFSPAGHSLGQFRFYVLSMLGAGIVAVFAYLSPFLRKLFNIRAWLCHLPMFEHLERIDNAARALARTRRTVIVSLLITVALQALAVSSYFVVAVAVGMKAGTGVLLEYYAYFSTGAVIQALPGPPQGLGTVELAYRYFFAPFGNPSQIVFMALAIRLVVLGCSLPGALVALTGAYRPQHVTQSGDQDEQPLEARIDSSHYLAAP